MFPGLTFSILVSVLFAVYAVPRKFSKQNAVLYTMWMGAAYFIGSLFLIVVMRNSITEDFTSPWHLVTAARGLIWAFGMAAYNLAIDKIGLARFNQWKNFQGPIGSLLMLVLIPEVAGAKVIWLLLGTFTIFVSAVLFTITTRNSGAEKKNTFWGVACALVAAVCFGASALLNKIVSDQGFLYAQLVYHSLSLIVFSAIVYIIGQKTEPLKERLKNLCAVGKETLLPIMGGGMYITASILTILSYRMIAGTIAWGITQLNSVWTILIGIFIFREISFRQYWLRITAGFITALIALVFFFLAL